MRSNIDSLYIIALRAIIHADKTATIRGGGTRREKKDTPEEQKPFKLADLWRQASFASISKL